MTPLAPRASPTTTGELASYLADLDDETVIIEVLGNLEMLARDPGEAGRPVAATGRVVALELLRRFAPVALRRATVANALSVAKLAAEIIPGSTRTVA